MVTDFNWWAFVLLTPLAYWLVPQQLRAMLLALANLGFLLFYAPRDVAVMLVLASISYSAFQFDLRLWTAYRSIVLTGLVLAYLFWSKYLPVYAAALSGQVSIHAVIIPLGVSYFCFKLIHYVIERSRGNLATHTFADFAGFMFLVPIFSAGPIERFEHYLEHRETRFKFDYVVEGGTRIVQGLVKKFVVCIILAEVLERTTGGSVLSLMARLDTVSPIEVWIFLSLSLAYVYFDFSAYSDIAIGVSRLFGLRIMENFNYPFLATNLRDFWQRWHMTLAIWCRTYIYMGMIGWTRNPYIAVTATFGVMGLWHAGWPLNWLAWGLWHGVGIIVVLVWSRFVQKRRITLFKNRFGQLFGWILTMGYVSLGGAFTSLHGLAPLSGSFRLIAKAFAVSL